MPQEKIIQMLCELIKRIWVKLGVNKGIKRLLSVKNTNTLNNGGVGGEDVTVEWW